MDLFYISMTKRAFIRIVHSLLFFSNNSFLHHKILTTVSYFMPVSDPHINIGRILFLKPFFLTSILNTIYICNIHIKMFTYFLIFDYYSYYIIGCCINYGNKNKRQGAKSYHLCQIEEKDFGFIKPIDTIPFTPTPLHFI